MKVGAPEGVSDIDPRSVLPSHTRVVEVLRDAKLGRHPALEERLKGVNIKLGEELPEGGI